jgi:hypothetical protein
VAGNNIETGLLTLHALGNQQLLLLATLAVLVFFCLFDDIIANSNDVNDHFTFPATTSSISWHVRYNNHLKPTIISVETI